jgi:hypothetical protein
MRHAGCPCWCCLRETAQPDAGQWGERWRKPLLLPHDSYLALADTHSSRDFPRLNPSSPPPPLNPLREKED